MVQWEQEFPGTFGTFHFLWNFLCLLETKVKRLINKRNVSRETTVKEINAQRIQNAIVLGWNFCAQLPISSIANDLSLPGPDLIQVKCIQQSEQLLHVKILMWPGEFMSTFIYASNDDEVVWIPSKSAIFSIASAWDQIRQKKPTVFF